MLDTGWQSPAVGHGDKDKGRLCMLLVCEGGWKETRSRDTALQLLPRKSCRATEPGLAQSRAQHRAQPSTEPGPAQSPA